MQCYNDYPTWLRQKYGQKVYKVPVGLNLTCPNRDGTCGSGGCNFCGEIGAGYERDAGSIGQQIRARIGHIAIKHNASLFIPYFLNFSNTYMPPDRFRRYIEAAAACCANENETEASDSCVNRKIAAIYIATRPDCIAKEYLDAMAEVREKYGVDICIELGLQSVNYHTLTEINRGHGLAEFIDRAILFLEYLSPDIVIQRLIGRAQQENTLFSNWGKPFFTIRDEILAKMERTGSYQGKHFDYLGGKAVRQFLGDM